MKTYGKRKREREAGDGGRKGDVSGQERREEHLENSRRENCVTMGRREKESLEQREKRGVEGERGSAECRYALQAYSSIKAVAGPP